jgi:small GTP-binding protein
MSKKVDFEIKLAFIGQSTVGKTSLITQYTKKTFADTYLSTIGADQIIKELKLDNGLNVKLNIWDTAGQERFRSVNAIFLKGAQIVIMVYDITKRDTFDEIKNYWYNNIKNIIGKDTIIGIAGNKSDLYENEQVTKEEGQQYAQEIKAIFKETTATTFESINELINELVQKYFILNNVNNFPNKEEGIKVKNTKTEKKKNCC